LVTLVYPCCSTDRNPITAAISAHPPLLRSQDPELFDRLALGQPVFLDAGAIEFEIVWDRGDDDFAAIRDTFLNRGAIEFAVHGPTSPPQVHKVCGRPAW
jgi:hypothetical protein